MSSGIGIYLLFHVRRREVWCSFQVFCWKGRNFESKKRKEQSATCVVPASQREDKSVAPERHDVHRIHVFLKAFYGAEKNAFPSLSQSIRRAWFLLSGEVTLQRSPFNDTPSGQRHVKHQQNTVFEDHERNYWKFLPVHNRYSKISIFVLPILGKLNKIPEVLRLGSVEWKTEELLRNDNYMRFQRKRLWKWIDHSQFRIRWSGFNWHRDWWPLLMSTVTNRDVEKWREMSSITLCPTAGVGRTVLPPVEFVTGNIFSKRNVTDVGTRNPDFKTASLRWLNQIYSLQRFICIVQV